MAVSIPLKKKYKVQKPSGGGSSKGRTAAKKKPSIEKGLRPRRRAWGPF